MDVSSILYLFSLAAGAAVVTALMIWLSLRAGYAQRMAVDLPNRRSLHARATPRIGGWALIPVAVAGAVIWARRFWRVSWMGLGLALISSLDDWRGLCARAFHRARVSRKRLATAVSAVRSMGMDHDGLFSDLGHQCL